MQDKYEDVFDAFSGTLIYTPENIPCAQLEADFLEEFVGCECLICTDECPCQAKSGAHFADGFLTLNDTGKPLYECHTNCSCNDRCRLRLTQFGPTADLQVKLTDKGHGLFANAPILKNRFVCEYAGEVITDKEAATRQELYKDTAKTNYIFWVTEHFGGTALRTIIDPTRIGNVGRFVNHSCDPNCALVPVRVSNAFPKLCIFAGRDIGAGDEITFDYGGNESGLVSSGGLERTKCLCGTDRCVGFLPFHTT